MAGTTMSEITAWAKLLEPEVIERTKTMVAPLKEIHTFRPVPRGAKTVDFPVATGTSEFTSVTDAAEFDTISSRPLTIVTVTPTTLASATRVMKDVVLSDPAGWLEFYANDLANGAFRAMVAVLDDLYATLTAAGTTNTDISAAILGASLATLSNTNEEIGGIYGLITPKQYTNLMVSLGNIATYGMIGSSALAGARYLDVWGAKIFAASGLSNNDTDAYQFLGSKDCIGFGMGHDLDMTLIDEGPTVKIVGHFSFAAGVLNSNGGVWLKSKK